MIDTNRLIAMREIETNLRAEGQSSRADCFLELIYEIDRLRVDLAKAQKKADDIHLELRIVKHQLEQARIWNGSGWDWNPLHGHLARKMWLRLDNLTRSNTEETK